MMKKAYSVPQMIVHGNIEELTQFFSQNGPQDTLFVGQQPLVGKGEDNYLCEPTGNGKDLLCITGSL